MHKITDLDQALYETLLKSKGELRNYTGNLTDFAYLMEQIYKHYNYGYSLVYRGNQTYCFLLTKVNPFVQTTAGTVDAKSQEKTLELAGEMLLKRVAFIGA